MPKGYQRSETLDQFSATIDAHLGHPVGFAEAVRRLHVVRRQRAQIKAARDAVLEQLRGGYDTGHRVVVGTEYELWRPEQKPAKVYRAAESAVVKKADAKAWQSAQVAARWVQVKPPPGEAAVPEVAVPVLAKSTSLAIATVTYKEHPAWKHGAALAAEADDIIAALDKIGADCGWDGGVDEADVFADGWSVRLWRKQFDSDRLREVDPALWDKVATTKVSQPMPPLLVRKVGDLTDLDGAVDLDGE